MASYHERLLLPLEGSTEIEFFTKTGTLVARGYERVVIGSRGPFIEFAHDQIIYDNIHVPEDQKWRLEPGTAVYFNEHRSSDDSAVKIVEQRKTMADYKEGHWYISPFDLTTVEYPVLVKPLDRKKKKRK